MFFKNITFFHMLPRAIESTDQIKEAVEKLLYSPLLPSEETGQGWYPVAPDKDALYRSGRHILLCAKLAKKILPSAVLKEKTAQAIEEIEHKQGRAVGKKQKAEIKEQVRLSLLKQAFTSEKNIYVWINLAERYIAINTTAKSQLDTVITLLSKTFTTTPLVPYEVNAPIRSYLGGILFGDLDVPDSFSIENTFIVESNDDQKLKVNYKNYELNEVEVEKHINAGLIVSLLGMTWKDRIYCMLLDSFTLQIKGIEPLNKLAEDSEQASFNLDDESDAFDVNFFMMTKEIDELRADLVEELGGLKPIDIFE